MIIGKNGDDYKSLETKRALFPEREPVLVTQPRQTFSKICVLPVSFGRHALRSGRYRLSRVFSSLISWSIKSTCVY
jgi:hypothetical protein